MGAQIIPEGPVVAGYLGEAVLHGRDRAWNPAGSADGADVNRVS